MNKNTDKENLAARYRYHSPFIHEGTAYLAKLTVEAFKRQSDGTRIYTIEALEIVKPTTFKASSISEERRNYNRVAGFEEKLQSQFEELKQELSDQPKKSTRDSSPFAIGPSRLADLLRDDAASRIRNPEARAKALSRISRALEDVRLEAERLEIGSKRLRKSLQREAAVRQAMRFEELENQALAQHSGILSDEDLTILTAQPIHSQMVSESKDSAGRTRKRGVLMSRAAAAKKNRDLFSQNSHGEYDGSAGMSPVIFGELLGICFLREAPEQPLG